MSHSAENASTENMDMNQVKPSPQIHIMAFDPGDKNNGFCHFKYSPETKKADLRIKTILSPKALHDMLKVVWGIATAPDKNCVFVVENFRVDTQVRGNTRNTNMFQWNEVKTSRVIGKIEMVADWTDSPIVYQEPRILHMGRKWCDFPVPKSSNAHIKDDVSAYIHGAHYLMDKKMIRGVDDIIKFGQESL